MTMSQKELLTWLDSEVNQANEPIIFTRYKQNFETLQGLKCHACQVGKQERTRTTEGTIRHQVRLDKDGGLKKGAL